MLRAWQPRHRRKGHIVNVVKLVSKWIGAVLLILLGLIFFVVGLVLCMTIVGIVPGFFMCMGALSFIVFGFGLVLPDTARRVAEWRERTKSRLVKTSKV